MRGKVALMLYQVIDVAILALPLIATLVGGAMLGLAVERGRAIKRRQAWEKLNGARGPSSLADAADQLRIVMGADFSAQPLLNKPEKRVFRQLETYVKGYNPGWLVMAQVSLGEILRSQSADAYRCINSKRVDLLLVDENCRPRHVIEYQGTGHHQGTAAARDAVKKEALRRAGIGYHEVVAGQTTPSDLKQLVQRLVKNPALVHPED
jgi:hypothetical protein